MITADTKEDSELKKVNVKNYLDAMELKGISLRFEQEKVLKSILPIFPPQDIEPVSYTHLDVYKRQS